MSEIQEYRPAREDGWTWERQGEFLAALTETGSVTHACERVGMTTASAYRLRLRLGPRFREAWKKALRVSFIRLRESAMERAINGTRVPLYSLGEIVGERVVHNERLVTFLLKTRGGRRVDNADVAADGNYDEDALDAYSSADDWIGMLREIAPEAGGTDLSWGMDDHAIEDAFTEHCARQEAERAAAAVGTETAKD